MRRTSRYLMTIPLLLAGLSLSTGAQAFNANGGSGLVDVDQAYSMSIMQPMVSIYSSYFSNDFTPGTSRFFTLVPSATMGLGAGFEGSASLGLEGLTTGLDEGGYDRRFDLRYRDLTTKLRWTSALGSPAIRAGVQGLLGVPLSGRTRPGGTESPDPSLDAGLMALISGNIGWFDFPVRVHGNVGYWWSRNDGAYYFRHHPLQLPIPAGDASNDVVSYGLAVEAGLRRVVVFAEVISEHLMDVRSQVGGSENLWRLTPGFRTQLSPSIGLTGAISLDLSSNDPETEFDPGDVYPDVELIAGISLGSVLSRERYEEKDRLTKAQKRAARLAASQAAAEQPPVPVVESPAPVIETAPEAVSEPAASVVHETTTQTDRRVQELEQRLYRLELAGRLEALENRMRLMERPATSADQTPAPAAAPTGPVPVAETGPSLAEREILQSLSAIQARLDSLSAAEKSAAAVPPPATATADTARVTTQAEPIETSATEPAATGAAEPIADQPLQLAATTGEATSPAAAPAEADTTEAAPTQPQAMPDRTILATAGGAAIDSAAVAAAAAREERIMTSLAALQARLDSLAQAGRTVPPAPSPVTETSLQTKAVAQTQPTAAAVPMKVESPPTQPAETGPTIREQELQRQIDTMQRQLNELSRSQPAPVQPIRTQPAGVTVVHTDQPAPPVTEVLVPVAASASGQVARPPVVTSGAAATPAVTPVTGQTSASESIREPVTSAATPAATPVAEPLAAAPEPGFPYEIGSRDVIPGFDLSAANPAAQPAVQDDLVELARQLTMHPEARISILVHGAGTDRAQALQKSEEQANLLRDFLVAAGAEPQQVVPFGMGLAEPLVSPDSPEAAAVNARVEIERIQ